MLQESFYLSKTGKALDWFFKSSLFMAIQCVILLISWRGDMRLAGYTLFLIATFIVITQKSVISIIPTLCLFSFCINITDFTGNLDATIPVIIFIVACIVRLAFTKKLKLNAFAFSLLGLGVCWFLGGVYYRFAEGNGSMTFPLAMLAIAVMYAVIFTLLLNCIPKDETHPIGYFAKAMFYVGLLLCAEMLICIRTAQTQHPDMTIVSILNVYAKNIFLMGWGNANTLGAVFTLTIPMTLFLSTTTKKNVTCLVYICLALLQTAFAIITMNRGALIFILALLPVELILSIIYSKCPKTAAIFTISLVVIAGIFCAVKYDDIRLSLSKMLEIGLDDNGRFSIYMEGLNNFKEYPIFGKGFDYRWGRDGTTNIGYYMHNTVIQVMSSFGTVGLIAYAYNYFLRFKILLKSRRKQFVFPLLMMICFEATNMLGTHTFSIALLLICFICFALLYKQEEYLIADEPQVLPFSEVALTKDEKQTIDNATA